MDNTGKNFCIGYAHRRIRLSATEKYNFWKKVHRSRGCWRWTGSRNRNYGQVVFIRGQRRIEYKAHIVAYNLMVGDIPKGLVIDHKCMIPLCVNPRHMDIVTRRENTMRGGSPPALNARKIVCNLGHRDWYKRQSGARVCRKCANIRQSEYRSRRRRKTLNENTNKFPYPNTMVGESNLPAIE